MSDSNDAIPMDVSFVEYLEFEYLEVGDFQVDTQNAEIKIRVYNLIVLDKHPQYSEIEDSVEYVIVFSNVSKAQRRITKYKEGDSKADSFETTEVVDDEFEMATTGNLRTYYLGGVLRKPRAWIGWDIEAEDYKIQLP